MAATEDGNIQKCSKTYTDNTLATFTGHQGPVYKVRCNKFMPEIFLTCSADWSCKLWNLKSDKPLIYDFQSLEFYDEVMDVEWCPYVSTLFASVAKDGRLELWDLEHSTMDCCIEKKPSLNDVMVIFGCVLIFFRVTGQPKTLLNSLRKTPFWSLEMPQVT